jgi:glucose/arabinose dehydrogenase
MKCDTPVFGRTVAMQLIAQVAETATLVTSPPGDPRLFVVQQRGAIRIIENGVLLDPFLDLSEDANGPVKCCGENGLLGLAFHPRYATNGQFFVTYTARLTGDPANAQRNVLARCTVSADPNRSDPASCVDVISIPDHADNHNGGMIEFGPDGYLYWGTGDGGSGGALNAQALEDGVPTPNTKALFGKILRLDIDTRSPGLEYGIPADNPFATGGGRPEIFIRGLRNPWRWSFDRLTGDLWIADVGQKQVEELTVLRPHQQPGANLGWPVWEGSRCYTTEACALTPQVVPQDERLHADGWHSIIGGQVYRGACFPDLQGTYFYTDNDVQNRLATAKLNADDTLTVTDLPGSYPPNGASLHEAAAGELYETDTAGNIFKLVVVGP